MARQDCLAAIVLLLVALVSHLQIQLTSANVVSAAASASVLPEAPIPMAKHGQMSAPIEQPIPSVIDFPLNQLKQMIANTASLEPYLFDPEDLRMFLNDEGAVAANRFINQRQYNVRRAVRLARSALKWRKDIDLNNLQASDFPCDLFEMGLIFEQGHAHQQTPDGQSVRTNPVIWLRLGALGGVIKRLEKLTPSRVASFAYNYPRGVMNKARKVVRKGRRSRKSRRGDFSEPLIRDMSMKNQETIGHVLRAIAWWLNDWVHRNEEDARATLVLDFENTDYAFASWSVGEFLVKLDDLFPDLFDQIIGFRYKPKLWSMHTPISMFNRIFKSRVASSPETDRKLKFVTKEPEISLYIPRVDTQGFTMLPEYVSGHCHGPDESKSPAGCHHVETGGNGLYDPNFWSAIRNEFYYSCKAKTHS